MPVTSPPVLSDEQLATLQLSLVDGLSPAKLLKLIERFGSACGVLSAAPDRLLAALSLDEDLAAAIRSSDRRNAEDYLRRLQEADCRLLFRGGPGYPGRLAEIHSPPTVLCSRGELADLHKVAVAIVGSRRCTAYGRRIALQLARELASRGIVVVSGLARGIDSVAHRGALEVGGRTVAVLASGLANVYPPEHAELANQIAANGALVSEARLDGPPIGKLFPQRNRIISGLSLGVIVVEAASRSGALSTAFHALEQNRDVFAVPGRIGDPYSAGANRLIKEGAIPVTSFEDVLQALGTSIEAASSNGKSTFDSDSPPPGLSENEMKLWNAVGKDDAELEEIIQRTGLRASEASSALLMMELRRIVHRLPGNRYERVR